MDDVSNIHAADHDDDILDSVLKRSKSTTFTAKPSPSLELSAAAGDEPKPPVTPEQLFTAALKENKALKEEALKQQAKAAPPSSNDSSSSNSNSSPEKHKKSKEKKKSGQDAAVLRAKAKLAAAAAAEVAAAEAAAGKRKRKKKEKRKKDKDISCSDDSSSNSDIDGSGGSSPSSSDDNGHRRRKKQRKKQHGMDPSEAVRKFHKQRTSKCANNPLLNWYVESHTDQAILAERARASKRIMNWCTIICAIGFVIVLLVV